MSFFRDLRHGVRSVSREPLFTVSVVVTLALCIGANTAVFSVLNEVLFRPLPYPEVERLARLAVKARSSGQETLRFYHDGTTWDRLKGQVEGLDLAIYSSGSSGVNFSSGDSAEFVRQQRVSAGFFRVLGVHPLLGREFDPQEDLVGGPPVTVLSYAFWQRALAGRREILGQTILLRGQPFEVVGIMPAGFRTDSAAELWTPLKPSTTGEGSGTNYAILARVAPDSSWQEAESHLAGLTAAVFEGRTPSNVSYQLALKGLQESQTLGVRQPLLVLWAAVGVVLLIGCVNIAGLLLARTLKRSREIATRMALGGGRWVVLRQLLAESVVLALLGGVSGLLLGYWALEGIYRLLPAGLATPDVLQFDWRVLALTAGIALTTGLIFGIFPAIQAGRVDIRSSLSDSGTRGATGGRPGSLSRRFLVATQVTLAFVLLVGAGLLVRTLTVLHNLSPGFESQNVVTAGISLQDARYETSQAVNRLFEKGTSRLAALPQVETAAAGLSLPYQRGLNMPLEVISGGVGEQRREITNLCYVTPDYFRALRIPLLRGRLLSPADDAHSAPVALVNQAFAERHLAPNAPVGAVLQMGSLKVEVVGVVGDVRQTPGWGGFGPLGLIPAVYVPVAQTNSGFLKLVHTWFTAHWVVRTRSAPEASLPLIRETLQAVDPFLPLQEFRSTDQILSQVLSWRRFQGVLLSLLAGLALLLAAVGIYGLIAASVGERTREFGVRIALGADWKHLLRQVLGTGLLWTAFGTVAGTVLALASVQVMEHLVWGVETTDPATFLATAALLLIIAVWAGLIPAIRVMRMDPAATLKAD